MSTSIAAYLHAKIGDAMVKIRVTNSKVINRPVREVFDFLSDFGRHREWDREAESFKGPAGPVELGATFQKFDVFDAGTGGPLGASPIRSTRVVVREVTYVDRDRWLEYKISGENGWLHRIEFFGLQPAPEGTLLTKGTDLMYPSLRRNFLWLFAPFVPVFWPFVVLNLLWLPSIIFSLKRSQKEKLGRIKDRLEDRQGPDAGGLSGVR